MYPVHNQSIDGKSNFQAGGDINFAPKRSRKIMLLQLLVAFSIAQTAFSILMVIMYNQRAAEVNEIIHQLQLLILKQ